MDGKYISVAHVQLHVPQIPINVDSVLTPEGVGAYIEVVEAEINAILVRHGVKVPVGVDSGGNPDYGLDSVGILRSLAIPGVLHRVFMTQGTQPGIRGSERESTREMSERAQYRDNKKMLRDGTIVGQLLQGLGGVEIDKDISQGPTTSETNDDILDRASDWHEFTDAEYARHSQIRGR